jgi:hypothetical protein
MSKFLNSKQFDLSRNLTTIKEEENKSQSKIPSLIRPVNGGIFHNPQTSVVQSESNSLSYPENNNLIPNNSSLINKITDIFSSW